MTRVRALWKYNELVLTNYGAHFSEHFETSYKTHEGGGLFLCSLDVLFHFFLVAIAVMREMSSTDFQQLVLNSLRVTSEFCLSHLGWNLH